MGQPLINGEHRGGTVLIWAMLKTASPYQFYTLWVLYFVRVKSQKVKHAGPGSLTMPSVQLFKVSQDIPNLPGSPNREGVELGPERAGESGRAGCEGSAAVAVRRDSLWKGPFKPK